jgi:hypothetical protein
VLASAIFRWTAMVAPAGVALLAVAAGLWVDAVPPGPFSQPARLLDSEPASSAANPAQGGTGVEEVRAFPKPTKVVVQFIAGRHKNPAGQCQLGQVDYALAVDGTWEAPTLRFFGDGRPATESDPQPRRAGQCDGSDDVTWVHAFATGQVIIWEL